MSLSPSPLYPRCSCCCCSLSGNYARSTLTDPHLSFTTPPSAPPQVLSCQKAAVLEQKWRAFPPATHSSALPTQGKCSYWSSPRHVYIIQVVTKNKKVCRVETKMRWCTLGFTSPTFLLPNRFAFLPDSNVGKVNPNVHHLILVSTLHTFLFFEFFCYYLFQPLFFLSQYYARRKSQLGAIFVLY